MRGDRLASYCLGLALCFLGTAAPVHAGRFDALVRAALGRLGRGAPATFDGVTSLPSGAKGPQLVSSSPEKVIGRAAAHKSFMRVLSSGGPIAQPPFQIIAEDSTLRAHIGSHGPDATFVRDTWPTSVFRYGPAAVPLATALETWQRAPVVDVLFKPDNGMQGTRIVFVSKRDSRWTLSFADSSYNQLRKWAPIDDLAKLKGAQQDTSMPDVLTISFDPSDAATGAIQKTIHGASIDRRANWQLYAPGMFEQRETLISVGGNAYETRHPVLFDIKNQTIEMLTTYDKGPLRKWIGRIGSSPLFSNYLGREDRAQKLLLSEMFDPLFESQHLSVEEAVELRGSLDTLLRQQSVFVLGRLAEMGVSSEDRYLVLEYDLGWQATSGSLPQPMIIESSVTSFSEADID